MTTFTFSTTVPHPVAEVFSWFERPGAFLRLTPPTMARVVAEPSNGLQVGSESALKVFGIGSAVGVGVTWRARHTAYRPGEAFTDVMLSGPMSRWEHRHTFEPDASGTATVIRDEVEYALPLPRLRPAGLGDGLLTGRLTRMFSYRARQVAADLTFHAAHSEPRTIAITGASGLIGRQLAAFLGGGGHRVIRVVRGDRAESRPGEITWDPASGRLNARDLEDVDIVIHLAGTPIARRFTDAHRREVLDSRIASTRLIATALAELAADGKERALVSGSASGYYGTDRGDDLLDEDAGSGAGFLARVCRAWEAAAAPAAEAGVRVGYVRTGVVQSAAGGQLAVQLPIYEAGLGGPLGEGQQWMPWIGIDDIVGLFAHIALTPGLSGPINGVAPGSVRAGEYAATLARVLRRPALLRVPARGPAVVLGDEGARELALAGQRMTADRASRWGYAFRHPDLDGCLRHVLAR